MNEQAPQLHVEFFNGSVHNKFKSDLEGRPIFDDREMVRIKFPGDKNRVHVAPAKESFTRVDGEKITYAHAFPKHYEAFLEQKACTGEGTPVSELPFLSEGKREELRGLNIHTAETLAALDGQPLKRLGMGAMELKNQAIAYLEHAQGTASETRFAVENEALRQQMDELRAEMAQMESQEKTKGDGASVNKEDEANPFEDWDDKDLKVFIKEATGTSSAARASHKTLVRKALEANEALKEGA